MVKESIKIKKDADVFSIQGHLRALIRKEKPGMYIAYCPALDLYSQGATSKEARKNIIEAVQLFVESCIEGGTLDDVLRECGFHAAGEKMPRKRQKPVDDSYHGREIRIPAKIPCCMFTS